MSLLGRVQKSANARIAAVEARGGANFARDSEKARAGLQKCQVLREVISQRLAQSQTQAHGA